MKANAYNVLRWSLGITFIWIGVLIWQNPLLWAGFLQPWASNLVGIVPYHMQASAVLDILVGVVLLIGGRYLWVAAGLGALHIALVLITTTGSFDTVIFRDIGLLGAALALYFEKKPRGR